MQGLKPIWIRTNLGCHLLRIKRIRPEIPSYTRRPICILHWLLIYSFIYEITILIFHWWIASIMLIVHYHLLIRNSGCLTIETISSLHHLIEYCLVTWLNIRLILLRNRLFILTTWIVPQRKKISLCVNSLIRLWLVSLKLFTSKWWLHVWVILNWLATASICLSWFP
jgi:hypothetical protein